MRKAFAVMLISALTIIIIVAISFFLRKNDSPETTVLPVDSSFQLDFHKDFTEEELTEFLDLVNDGYNMEEALKISNPSKYKEILKKRPQILHILKNTYKDRVTLPPKEE